MRLVNINVGGKRIGLNLDAIVSIDWTDPSWYPTGGTAKMIDGSTIALDEKAMVKISAIIKIVDDDWDNEYER